MYSRVLVPLDGSEDAELAIEEALELAPAMKSAHLVLVETSVLQARRLEGYTVFVDEYVKIRKEMGKDYLLPFQKKLEAVGVKVSTTVVFGDPVASPPEPFLEALDQQFLVAETLPDQQAAEQAGGK